MIYTVDVPVGIGQTVYKLGNFNRITETTVEAIILRAGETKIKLACNTMHETSLKTLGRTWWLTRDEAESWVEKNNRKIL